MQAEAVFLDRAEERQAVDRLAESAREHGSGAVVFYGDAGIGKTATWYGSLSPQAWADGELPRRRTISETHQGRSTKSPS